MGFAAPLLEQPFSQRIRFHFIDVGQGDSTLVECPDGTRILIDGGSGIAASSRPEGVRAYLQEVLGENGQLDTVVVTHPDRDHYNALPYLLEGVTFGRMWLVGDVGGYNSAAFTQWLDAVPASKKAWVRAEHHDPQGSPSTEITCGRAEVYRLAAAATGSDPAWASNTASMVLMFSYGDFDAMLTGDATFETENKILGWYAPWWLDVEVLKIGHHGSSRTSTSDAWIDTVRPEVATVSAGFTNHHGHPRSDVITRVARRTTRAAPHRFRWYETQSHFVDRDYDEAIYATGTNGNIVVESDGASFWVTRSK
jgi:competence protein ComEC